MSIYEKKVQNGKFYTDKKNIVLSFPKIALFLNIGKIQKYFPIKYAP